MTKRVTILAGLAAISIASAAAAENRLVSPPLAGFVVGYEAGNEAQSIREEVPKGETVEKWTAMVTTQWFAIESPQLDKFAPAFLGGLKANCPAATYVEPARIDQFGTPAVLFSATCPKSPATGKRETMTVLAMAKGNAVFVKQVAFRGDYKGDTGWATTFLRATRVCDGACRN
jgi:hypothetical protein